MTLGLTAVFAVAIGLAVGLFSHTSTEDLIRAREEGLQENRGGVVDELLQTPEVQEMMRGERVEAAAAGRGR